MSPVQTSGKASILFFPTDKLKIEGDCRPEIEGSIAGFATDRDSSMVIDVPSLSEQR